MREIQVVLKHDRERPVEGRHPWIFSGAIDMIEDGFLPGDIVRVVSAKGEFLGKGYLNPHSEIAVRMLTYQEEPVNEDFFKKRIADALTLREAFLPSGTNAYRLINSEGDMLSGLVVDRYHTCLIVHILTDGMEHLRDQWIGALREVVPAKNAYARREGRRREESEEFSSQLEILWGEEIPDYVNIQEHGVKFIVDIKGGQKTGFFLDQRQNRNRLRVLSEGKKVLNTFSYTGGFSVYSALGGAESVTSVEISETALNMSRHNFELNGLKGDQYQFLKEDVFSFLRNTKEEYDMIILDPPAFARSKNQVMQATRGYKDINLWAMKKTKPGGILFSSSCSSYVSLDLFQKVLFAAAKDARRNIQVLEKTAQSFDHPVSIYHPEGEYLKSFLCRVLPL